MEKKKEKPSLSKSNFSWKEGGQRGGGLEEQKGGGEDDVICQRDYKECWQSMTADWVCARVLVCVL